MSVLELALAVALLTAPPDTFEFSDPLALHDLVAPAVKRLAVEWELLDPREEEYFKHAENFASDLKLLQSRFEEFAHAPKAADVNYFPNRDLLNDMIAFNEQFRKSVSNRLDLDMVHADELRDVLVETDYLHQVYDAAREARCEYFYVTHRRQALAQLRDLVGLEAYYAGKLPPHVPLWRFAEIN